MNRVFGYVTSRSFNGLTIPVPAQNSCLREFAASQNKTYIIPPLEHNFRDCYMQLYSVLKNIEDEDIVAMYSVGMMPSSTITCKEIINILKLKKSSLYFILESKLVKEWNDIKNLMFSYSLKQRLDSMNQISIPSLRDLTNTSNKN